MRSSAFQALRPLPSSFGSLRHPPLTAIRPRQLLLRPRQSQVACLASAAPSRAAKPTYPARRPIPPTDIATPPPASTSEVTPSATPKPSPIPTSDSPGSAPSAFRDALSATGADDLGPEDGIDWSSSFHGLSTVPFEPRVAEILMRPVDPQDIEVKPDGIVYLPEIKYRRILNAAFSPGGWGLAPRGELIVGEKVVTREYALVVHGRFIAQARGECQYFNEDSIPTAGEGCKSNALMRCCKDIGIASELWDPRFIRSFKKENCQEVWVEHVVNKKKRQVWVRKDSEPGYPYALVKKTAARF